MSVSFINFYNAVISLEKMDLLISGTFISVELYYVFLGNYVGQDVIDSSISICQATYNAHWYAAPLCMQKLILFIMQRSYRKSALTAGGLFDASLEGFAKLMSMSISYVMVLQSMGVHKESHEKHNSHV
ncbi:PREDICTED: putative odorant receptor 71a [Trachymyrmex cornetzi]|uniref:putative odorant receptor 71a n=1 Tax=Trachymyrmex cornetzi TaxID=471704 RepID=UPI00084F4D68|nr:PREDICTED: putative odorant receptor 71a [Trachymyrmex cornetzi]